MLCMIKIISNVKLSSLVSLLSAGEPGRSQDSDKQKVRSTSYNYTIVPLARSFWEVGLSFKLKI